MHGTGYGGMGERYCPDRRNPEGTDRKCGIRWQLCGLGTLLAPHLQKIIIRVLSEDVTDDSFDNMRGNTFVKKHLILVRKDNTRSGYDDIALRFGGAFFSFL